MNNFPFIIPSLLFISGILLNYYVEFRSFYLLIVLITILVILFFTFLINGNKLKSSITRIILHICFFGLGAYLIAVHEEKKSSILFENNTIDNIVVSGCIEKIDLRKEKEVTFTIETDSIRIDTAYQKIKSLLIVRARDDSASLDRLYNKLHPGNQVRIEGDFMKGREKRNPGEFDYNKYLRSKGISGIIYVRDAYDVKIINWNDNIFNSFIFELRKAIDQKINSLHNKQSAGLIRGLILADRSNIDYETKTEFINSGVIHILAVSGLHVGYIVIIFIFLFGRFNIYVKSILTILGLIVFLLLTGMPVSVFRAVLMAVTIVIAFLTNRTTNLYNSLAVAAFILLVINPGDLFNPGFQLSFTAVLSIAIIYPIFQKYIYKLKIRSQLVKYVILFAGVSLSVQIGTLPLTLIYFGKLSVVALFSNLIVIPIVGVVVAISIVTLVISAAPFPIYTLFAAANEFVIYHLFKFISLIGSSTFSFIPIKNFTIFDALVFYFVISLIILIFPKLITRRGKIIFVILVLINGILFSSLDNKKTLDSDKLNVLMIDVYRGNSFLIETPDNQHILMGGGYSSLYFDSGERTIMPLLDFLHIDSIDLAIITSMRRENFGGLISLIKNNKIKRVIKPPTDSSSILDLSLQNLLEEKGISIKYFSTDTMTFGPIKLYFIVDSDSKYSGFNSQSAILKLVYGKTSLLDAGEMQLETEYKYCKLYGEFLQSDVLIIANNGSVNSTSVEFLKTVDPKYGLISASNQDKFTNISTIIIERLKKFNVNILRTDENKAILLESDGKKISIINWN